MKDLTSTNACARAEDLVTYLYGEATRAEAKDFERHTESCSSCRTELATFGDVREAVSDWRRQALGSLTMPAVVTEAERHFAHARRRSALVALREFFTLSPTWMRAATGVAALVFCALAAIAVAYFVQQPQTQVVEKQVMQGYSEKDVEAKIADAIRKQNESRLKDASVPAPQKITVASNEQPKAQTSARRNNSAATQLATNNRRRQPAARAGARPAKMELASTDFLPFTAPTDEEKLPSLTDLVDEDN